MVMVEEQDALGLQQLSLKLIHMYMHHYQIGQATLQYTN